MFVDGTTHFLNDLSGMDQGFWYTNQYLAGYTEKYLRSFTVCSAELYSLTIEVVVNGLASYHNSRRHHFVDRSVYGYFLTLYLHPTKQNTP